jgi:hypothetical protein
MSNLIISMIVVVQIVMAVLLGMLVVRNGRNGARSNVQMEYEVASATSRPYQLTDDTSTASAALEEIPIDARLLPLDKAALQEAYHNQLILLWQTYLKSGLSDDKAIIYFKNGLRHARNAYNLAMTEIEKREKKLEAEKK